LVGWLVKSAAATYTAAYHEVAVHGTSSAITIAQQSLAAGSHALGCLVWQSNLVYVIWTALGWIMFCTVEMENLEVWSMFPPLKQ
jgi:hypothetical protein